MSPMHARGEHETLGAMFFDDGSPARGMDGPKRNPMWVARPNADEELEFYISGTEVGPDAQSIALAVEIAATTNRILERAIELAGRALTLAWIDCQSLPVRVALTDEVDTYNLWRGDLDQELQLSFLELGTW